MQTLLQIAKSVLRPINIGRVVLAVFATVTLFGIFVCSDSTMAMDASAPMIFDCGMMTTNAACPMSALDHITSWNKLFVASPTVDFLALLILTVSFAVVLYFLPKIQIILSAIKKYKNYLRQNFSSRLYDYLITVFSRGIVQPKLLA